MNIVFCPITAPSPWNVGPNISSTGIFIISCAPSDGRLHSSRVSPAGKPAGTRSEEHTSELQSRFDLVCRLLLEKKKQTDRVTTARKKSQTTELSTVTSPNIGKHSITTNK